MRVEVGKAVPIAGGAAAPVVIGGVRLRLYMRQTLVLAKYTKSRGSAEAAAEALRAAGVAAEAREGAGGFWRVAASVGRLAAASAELREAVAKAVREAAGAGLVPGARARRWLEALERGRTPPRGYGLTLSRSGALMVRYISTNPDSIEREARRLREMELVEGLHFTVKMPEGGKAGYVSVLKEGLVYAAWLADGGAAGERQKLAADFVGRILEKAEARGGAVYEKVRRAVEAGRAVGSLRLFGMSKEVEVGGRRHVVAVLSWDADWDRRYLRIFIVAEVDGVEGLYTATFYRVRGRVTGQAYARASAPGGAEADAERFAALVKALTGIEPKMYTAKGKRPVFFLGRRHLDGFARYRELANVVMGWLVASWLGGQ
jgi:hypothetical protein